MEESWRKRERDTEREGLSINKQLSEPTAIDSSEKRCAVIATATREVTSVWEIDDAYNLRETLKESS